MPRRILFKGFFYKTFGGGDNFGGCYFVLWAIFKGKVVLVSSPNTQIQILKYRIQILKYTISPLVMASYLAIQLVSTVSLLSPSISGRVRILWGWSWWQQWKPWWQQWKPWWQPWKPWWPQILGRNPQEKTFQSSKCKFSEKGKSAFSKSFSLKWDGKLSPKCHFEFFSLLL